MTFGQVAELIVGLIGGLGLGAVAGALIQSRATSTNVDKQLAHDIEARRLDYEHDLDVRRLEDQHRLRDQRLSRLRDGFLFLVQALLQLEEVLEEMKEGSEFVKGDIPRWRQLLLEANRKADQARAGLLLEKIGEPAIRSYVDLTRKLQIHWMYLHDVELGRQAASPDLPGMTRAYLNSQNDIEKAIVDQIRGAQEALAGVEAPITLDPTIAPTSEP